MKNSTWFHQNKILTGTIFGAICFCILLTCFPPLIQKDEGLRWASWTGFGEDKSVKSVKIEKISDKETIKTVEEPISAKTLWDWLNALIIPSSIAISGYLLQLQQKGQADANLREQALQAYLDALSKILLDKEWNIYRQHSSIKATGLDIIKARTLSLSRMFSEDKVRLAGVLRFLSDVNLLKEMQLELDNINLSGQDLNGINMSNVVLESSILSFTNFEDANLQQANFTGASLKKAYLKKADLRQATLGSMTSVTDLREADLTGTHLGEANLTHADLRKAQLRYANLCGTDLRGAKLQGAKFKKCLYSSQTHFPEGFTGEEMYLIEPDTKLSGAKLQNLLLMDADLQRANLQGSRLQRADFQNANLEEANLQNADLEGTHLQGANLRATNFQGAKNLTAAQVQAAKNWEFAHYDPEFCKQLGLSTETCSLV